MGRLKIKICGLTRAEDAVAAMELGADYLGLNFVGGPRKLKLEQAVEISRVVAGWNLRAQNRVQLVGLVRVEPPTEPVKGYEPGDWLLEEFLTSMQLATPIRHYQIYGATEKIAQVVAKNPHTDFAWWLPVGVKTIDDMMAIRSTVTELDPAAQNTLRGVVLDAKVAGQLGGTGHSFDWQVIAQTRAQVGWGEQEGKGLVMMLAGGLNAGNVAQAVRMARPWGVDVSSGVEALGRGGAGVKDRRMMQEFIQAAREAIKE